jgi:RNA polymerase sigma-70 factor (ECF subfamily)
MGSSSDFSPDVVRRAQEGDEKARRQLVEQLQPLLRAYFMKRIGDRTVVQDLMQNTLVRMHRSLDNLNHTDRFKGFVMKAALFELQDYYRGRYGMREELYGPDPVLEDNHPGGSAETSVDLKRALSILTPTSRRVLELREYGYKYTEIAEMLDLTEAAVKMRVKRAFEKLREWFAPSVVLLVCGGVTSGVLEAATLLIQ